MTRLANFEEVAGQLGEAAKDGSEPPVGKWVNGRIVAVLGSPELGNAADLAVGMSVLNPGGVTPRHDHRAEEIAIVVSGRGEIVIGDDIVAVTRGDVVRTPPSVPHQTRAAEDEQLQILWLYAPAGSEARWLADEPKE